jgi:hypothetical protein
MKKPVSHGDEAGFLFSSEQAFLFTARIVTSRDQWATILAQNPSKTREKQLLGHFRRRTLGIRLGKM